MSLALYTRGCMQEYTKPPHTASAQCTRETGNRHTLNIHKRPVHSFSSSLINHSWTLFPAHTSMKVSVCDSAIWTNTRHWFSKKSSVKTMTQMSQTYSIDYRKYFLVLSLDHYRFCARRRHYWTVWCPVCTRNFPVVWCGIYIINTGINAQNIYILA